MRPPGTTRDGERTGAEGPAAQEGHEPAAKEEGARDAPAAAVEPDASAAPSNGPATLPDRAGEEGVESATESGGSPHPAEECAEPPVEGERAEPQVPAPQVPAPQVRTPPKMDVTDLDWQAIRRAVDPPAIRSRMKSVVERMEALLDQAGGPGLMFDAFRESADDRAILVPTLRNEAPLWFVG